MDVEPPAQPEREPPLKQEPEENVTRERSVGSGMPSVCNSFEHGGLRLVTRSAGTLAPDVIV